MTAISTPSDQGDDAKHGGSVPISDDWPELIEPVPAAEFEAQRDHWQRRYMDVLASADRWRIKADDFESRNRDLLEVLKAHAKHPGVSHTMESLGYNFAWNAEQVQCECGHRALGVTDEQRAQEDQA